MVDLSDIPYGRVVDILWGDAWSSQHAYHEPGKEYDYTPKKTRTVGFFVEQNEQTTVVAWTLSDELGDDRARSVFIIPNDWIIEAQEVEDSNVE